MAKLSQQETDQFLAQPRIAHFATLRRAGTPHVAPVWFLWDQGRAWVMADSGSVKVGDVDLRNTSFASLRATLGGVLGVHAEGPTVSGRTA
mgnify:CR=1 FL=1